MVLKILAKLFAALWFVMAMFFIRALYVHPDESSLLVLMAIISVAMGLTVNDWSRD